VVDAILLLKILHLSPIALSDSDTAVHCDMVPESCMQVRNYLREDFVMHSSSKGSSDAEKRFQPAARRVFFAYRDVGTSRKARMPGVTRQGCRYVAECKDAGSDTPGMVATGILSSRDTRTFPYIVGTSQQAGMPGMTRPGWPPAHRYTRALPRHRGLVSYQACYSVSQSVGFRKTS
jgi:hypothetical protein